MFLAFIASATLHLAVAGAALPAAGADTAPNSSWQQMSPYDAPDFDAQAEHDLLDKANADRASAGLPPLKMDEGLVRAARAHAATMAARKHISHQFAGEPSPTDRITAVSNLHLERMGENVAVAPDVEDAHEALMASPPHRDNLLSAKFNVAGFGVIRQGRVLYVAQDFGLIVPSYSVQEAQELVFVTVEKLRSQAKMPQLHRVNDSDVQSNACAMAKADSLSVASPPPGVYLLRYTSMHPESLPKEISQVISRRGLHTYSAGACYARTQRYPSGAYWVVLEFY
ncbi:MAG: CAP domain-containing protein [Terriglobales bacterium]